MCTSVGYVGFEEVGIVIKGVSSSFVVGDFSIVHGKLSSCVPSVQGWLANEVMALWMVVSILHLAAVGSGTMLLMRSVKTACVCSCWVSV